MSIKLLKFLYHFWEMNISWIILKSLWYISACLHAVENSSNGRKAKKISNTYVYVWKQHLRIFKICIKFVIDFSAQSRDNWIMRFPPAVIRFWEKPKDVELGPVSNELLVMQKACHCNKSVLPTLRVPGKCGGVALSKCSGLL